jgi:hypothetical protein
MNKTVIDEKGHVIGREVNGVTLDGKGHNVARVIQGSNRTVNDKGHNIGVGDQREVELGRRNKR